MLSENQTIFNLTRRSLVNLTNYPNFSFQDREPYPVLECISLPTTIIIHLFDSFVKHAVDIFHKISVAAGHFLQISTIGSVGVLRKGKLRAYGAIRESMLSFGFYIMSAE